MTTDVTPESLTDLCDRREYATGKYVESPEHIPDEDSVLATYATDYYMVSVSGTATPEGRAAAFSRWLAAHDAEVAREALTDAADAMPLYLRGTFGGNWASNEACAWLRARAEQIGEPHGDN